MVLAVKGCDLVLGFQWLLSLGSIVWNFASLTMQFNYLGSSCALQGIVPRALHMSPCTQNLNALLQCQGPSPMLLTNTLQTSLNLSADALHQELEVLMAEFEDVFQLPKGLSPARLQDHRIPLHYQNQVVKIRP